MTTGVTENAFGFLANEFVPPVGALGVYLDTASITSGGTSGPFNAPGIVTTQNGDLLYSFADLNGGNAIPAGGLLPLNNPGSAWSDAYIIQGGAGPAQASWNGNAGSSRATASAAFVASYVDALLAAPGQPIFSIGTTPILVQ